MVDLLEVPLRAAGGFFAMSADTLRAVFSRPFQRREFIDQAWFVARVSMVPTVLVAIPFTVLVSFTINILLREIGATAICADLAARTIREEIDAMRVLGINPIHRLVVPRVLASTVVALLLNGLVCTIGILGGFLFSVYVQDVNPGAFVNGITLLTGFGELMISMLKAGLFGMIAGLMAAYLGMNVRGGAKSVGDAVNQTVVFSFMALFVVNVLITAIGIKLTSG